ncbi:helix-turn-helix domain-containing protein [Salinigranum marinum]|uniref:ArsR/SmtB family transcription factor n=1 Tax=Salinigranum marinum TaxID=1515595 RepID=UPI002989FBF9|nr:helix-turn-helix domain-containing protein [Salinigranum marinum]
MSLNAGMFPHRPPVDEPERETRTVTLGTEQAAALCGALASETATSILARLFEEPMTASDLADRVDTSLQNAHYHLERLRESDLIHVVDTWYSSRGVEMNVYAPTCDELVIAPSGADADAEDETETGEKEPETTPLIAGHPS